MTGAALPLRDPFLINCFATRCQKSPASEAPRPGRHHVGITGGIISECPGDFVGIRIRHGRGPACLLAGPNAVPNSAAYAGCASRRRLGAAPQAETKTTPAGHAGRQDDNEHRSDGVTRAKMDVN